DARRTVSGLNRHLTCEQMVERRPEGVDVGEDSEPGALPVLLKWGVARRESGRHSSGFSSRELAGRPKVYENSASVLCDDNILRLDVPMKQFRPMDNV